MSFVKVDMDGAIAVLTLNRPEALNAFDPELVADLGEAFSAIEADREVRVAIFTGAGDKAFSAGGDIPALRDMSLADGREFVERGQALLGRIEHSQIVSIAAVNGYALGGGTELALACDLRVAADTAQFGLPEVKLGIYPGWGGTQRLPRLVGAGRGKLLLFTGDQISASEALEIGLVERVVPGDELMRACRDIAERMCANSPGAIMQAKSSVVYGLEQPLAYALRHEMEAWLVNFASEDRVEGLSAFIDRRRPSWRGR